MKVICDHGFFKLYPVAKDDLRRFERVQGLKLEPNGDHFTFPVLRELPRFSIKGVPFGGLPATETIEGRDAGDVMRANKLVYSIALKALVPYSVVLPQISLMLSADYAIVGRVLLQPGTILQNGKRILSYDGVMNQDYQQLLIYSLEVSP